MTGQRVAGRLRGTAVVTGVSSFIGMHVACRLAVSFERVVGTCGRSAEAYEEPLRAMRLREAVRNGVTLAELDITREADVAAFISRERPAVWIHHAGYAVDHASPTYASGLGFRVNVAPLDSLYARLREAGCDGVIVTGSCMEYGDSPDSCREDDPCWPATPYGLSKLTETIRARQLSLQFGLKTRVVRVFIPYGRWDAPGRLMRDAAFALLRGEPIALSACTQQRDFIAVEDLAEGYLACIHDFKREPLFDIYNLCGGRAIPVREALLALSGLLEADPALLHFGERIIRSNESEACWGSNGKALEQLNWRPRCLREGLTAFAVELRSMGLPL
ncbi:MAG: NAD(P)-dependent oxidoreductase [Paenibacillaceae bacterium]|nr:NAD(P)-dependent oxidoreductase [Paenibacillaceae bacterium]